MDNVFYLQDGEVRSIYIPGPYGYGVNYANTLNGLKNTLLIDTRYPEGSKYRYGYWTATLMWRPIAKASMPVELLAIDLLFN